MLTSPRGSLSASNWNGSEELETGGREERDGERERERERSYMWEGPPTKSARTGCRMWVRTTEAFSLGPGILQS